MAFNAARGIETNDQGCAKNDRASCVYTFIALGMLCTFSTAERHAAGFAKRIFCIHLDHALLDLSSQCGLQAPDLDLSNQGSISSSFGRFELPDWI
jgi:hypothetical protein